MTEMAVDVEEFDHHEMDRTCSPSQKANGECRVDNGLANQFAKERSPTTNQAKKAQKFPAGLAALACQRRDNAETLSGIVQPEANHQPQGKSGAGVGWLAQDGFTC